MVFADLVGSTELAASLDPEELRRRLGPFFEAARSTLEDHGGTVEKYVGDAVLAVFGVPRAHGDDPDRAIAAGLALIERVDALDGDLGVRVGIETGDVLAMPQTADLAVTGEAVNAAARLQQAAQPGQVLVGERTARACRRALLERASPIDAKGLDSALPAFRAVALQDAADRPRVPMIGREDDIDLLRLVARRTARERTPEMLLIVGEAGIGKTRLAEELLDDLGSDPDNWRRLVGANPPFGRGIAFWALGEIVHDVAGVSLDTSGEEVEQSLRALLADLGAEDAGEVAHTLVGAIRGEGEGSAEDELKRAWRRFVALLAADRPIVIAIDDVHWADDGLLDLLEEVAFGLQNAPVLILCTGRPELGERRPDFGRAARNLTQVELRPLDRGAATELAELLLPASSCRLAPQVAEASGGNPFFAEEVSRAIREEDGGRSDGGLPDTVQAAIAARIDQLPDDEKRALQLAAVLGPAFEEQPLHDLLGRPPGDPLRELRRKALVEERTASGAGRYAFRHQLIREVAYASLPRAERARLHERAADAVRGSHGVLPELVAYHLTQAAKLGPSEERRAAAYQALREAAKTAVRRGANVRGRELWEHAAEVAAEASERIVDLRAAAETALRGWRGDHALRLLREEAAAAEDAGKPADAARAYARAVEVGTRMGGISGSPPPAELEPMLARGRELVAADDVVTRARLLLDEAWIAWIEAADERMREPAVRGLELARETGDLALLQCALDAVAASSWFEGRHQQAVEYTRERLRLLENAPRSYALDVEWSDALHMMIECLLQTGDYRGALEFAGRARELDLSRGIVYSAWERGLLPAFFLGRWEEVLEMGQRVREAWLAAETPPAAGFASSIASVGAIHGYRGEEEESEDWLALSAQLAARQPGAEQARLQTVRADIDLHFGQVGCAADRFDERFKGAWWRAPYFATRVEAFVRAGRSGVVDEAFAAAEESVGDNRYARGILLRARGLEDGDEGPLRESLALFKRIECPYQAARTGWLLGGEARAEAERTLERLRALPIVD